MSKFVQTFAMKHTFLLLISSLLLLSCARVGSPVGGARDTIPPAFLGSNIDSPRVNVSTSLKELRLDFDEYVTLKEISKNLVISPPIKQLKKILPSGLASKTVLIQWEDELQPSATYNFNFGNAIADFNEGNVLPYFNYAFSTGPELDNLYISGIVKKPVTKNSADQKESRVVVALYKDSDSVDYKQKPYYLAMAEEDGYFELNYLAKGAYRIIAFEDANANSLYDPGENVDFKKDKIVMEQNISGMPLQLSPSKKLFRYRESKPIPGGILLMFEGNPAGIEVASVSEKLKEYQVTHRKSSDSVEVWFDAAAQNIGTTASENLKFSYDAPQKKDTVSTFYRNNLKTELQLSNRGGNLLVPGNDFTITANLPVDRIDPGKWSLVSDAGQQPFTAEISKEDAREIKIKSNFEEGKKYSITVPRASISSFYWSTSTSYRFDFETDKLANYGNFTLRLNNKPNAEFWIDLLDDRSNVFLSRKSTLAENKFTTVKPGRYTVRIRVDNNGNGIWDLADFATATAAEEVYYYEKPVEVRPLWDIVETWDINQNKIDR